MAFISDKEIKVKARGQLKTYRFDRIGFEDKRNGKPNRLWLFLKAFAATGGRLSWQDLGRTGMNENQVQSNVKRLRKVLRRFMGIDDDPFESYEKVKAYQTKFTISGDASVLTDSYDDTSQSDLETVYEADKNRSR